MSNSNASSVGGATGGGNSRPPALPPAAKRSRVPLTISVPATGAPKEYERTGTGRGMEKSTKDVRNAAMNYFDIFLSTKHIQPYNQIPEGKEKENLLCSIPLLQEFGTFLSFDAGK